MRLHREFCELLQEHAASSACELVKGFDHELEPVEIEQLCQLVREKVQTTLLAGEGAQEDIVRKSWATLAGDRESLSRREFCRRVLSIGFFEGYIDPHKACRMLTQAVSGEPSSLRDCLKDCSGICTVLQNNLEDKF